MKILLEVDVPNKGSRAFHGRIGGALPGRSREQRPPDSSFVSRQEDEGSRVGLQFILSSWCESEKPAPQGPCVGGQGSVRALQRL